MNAITRRQEPNPATNTIAMSSGPAGTSLAPQNLGEVMRFSEVMSNADIALPKHLRGNQGACLAVAMQAMNWQMSPFAVAQKTYLVNAQIAYEAQIIAAVINTRSGLKRRLEVKYTGKGASRQCIITGEFEDGSVHVYESPEVGTINPKNSPLWKSDPDQQLAYYSIRSFGRRYCPEVILGVYDRDEVAAMPQERDVTPAPSPLAQRLQQAKASSQPTRHVIEHTIAEIDGPLAGGEPDHDAVTGEIIEGDTAEGYQEPQGAPQDDDVFPGDLPSGQSTEAPQQPDYDFKLVRQYAAAMFRCTSLDSLLAGHNGFFESEGIDAPDVTSTDTLWGRIYAAHQKRIGAGKPRETVEKWINVAFAKAGEVV